jgi:AcrR family transcriptional regulator
MVEKKYHHGDLKNALIEAAVEILAQEGVGGLSLRKVAGKAGVSHAAPYAHFADKQALIAAISTEGFRTVYDRIRSEIQRCQGDPLQQLVGTAWAYVQFAIDKPAHFKITFSGAVEKQKDYPSYVEISRESFGLVVQVVKDCQAAGILKNGPSDALAVSVWSLVHGFVSLYLEDQISHTLLERMSLRQALIFSLNQITCVEIPPDL